MSDLLSTDQTPQQALNVDRILGSISRLHKVVCFVQKSVRLTEGQSKSDDSSTPNGERAKNDTAEQREVEGGGCSAFCLCRQGYVESTSTNSLRLANDENLKVHNQAEKLLRDLNYIQSQISKFNGLESHLRNLEEQTKQLNQLRNTDASFSTRALHQLQAVADKVKNMKNQMPGHNAPVVTTETGHQSVTEMTFNVYHLLDKQPIPEIKEKIQGTSCFVVFLEDFNRAFANLDLRSRLCLLCFSIFPENAVVPKKLLVYWWIGEGLVDDPQLSRNKEADEVLGKLCSNGFIKPILKNRKLSGFEMDPLVRFVVVVIAERLGFFSFDQMGVPTAEFSSSHRACLVKHKDGDFSRRELTNEKNSDSNKSKENNLDHLHTMFNVNDPYPDFKLDWFSKLKMLNVLYLGGWKGSKGHHIEVEGLEFLGALKNMKYLKFLSLQGISRITDLPDSLCTLTNLKILDLNACHHLESLPKKLEELKNLTHLDISECYLLDHIPKGLGQLEKLEVLKGFVVGSMRKDKDSCTLDDLKGLRYLKKLSITSSRDDFPSENEVTVLKGFENLKKLTIAWGGKSSKAGGMKEALNNTKKEEGDKENVAQANEEGKGKISEEKGDRRNVLEQDRRDKVKSVEQKMGDEGNITEQKEITEKGSEQKGQKETKAEGKKESKEVSKGQQEGRGSSAEQMKAHKGLDTDKKRVNILEQKVQGDTTEQKKDKGNYAETMKGDNISPKSPHAMQSQQSAQPAMVAKLAPTLSRKLTAITFRTGPSTPVSPAPEATSRLEKLELQCCPLPEAPDWMVNGKLKPSKKLYIRGGNLHTLKDGQGNHAEWSVKILCLKYLADLEMDWREFQKFFPNAVYLEKSCCPKLTFFPCNSSGVWINRKSKLLDEVKKDLSWSFIT